MGKDLDDFLAHYGIKGMRWGIRRSVDSSTGLVEKSSAEGQANPHQSADHARAAKALAKATEHGRSSLSNEELNAITKRIEAEKKFLQLTSDQKSELQKKVDELRLMDEYRKLSSKDAEARKSTGRRLVDSLIQTGSQNLSKAAADYGKKVIEDMLAGQKVPDPYEALKRENEAMKIRKENRQLKNDLFNLGERRGGTPFKVNPAKVKVSSTPPVNLHNLKKLKKQK